MTTVSQAASAIIGQGAHLTLHYRLATEEGEDIVSTFAENPATLQLGTGHLAPFLEQCLLGLPEGAHQVFHLTPEQAFGVRNPELLRRLSRQTLAQNSTPGEDYAIGDLVEFAAPSGGQFAGVLCEIDEETALFDFNHPLAGQPVQFEVKIIGIL